MPDGVGCKKGILMAKLRLDKFLADMQLGTRSQVKEYIRKGRISVNNNNVMSPDMKVDTETDFILFDGRNISYEEYEYYMLNKPAGVLSTTRDKNTKTVLDLIEDKARKDLFPVGRLDKDTEGLLLITNDGALAHDLLSPKKHVDKTYYAKINGQVLPEHIIDFKNGIYIEEDIKTLPANLKIIKSGVESEIELTIHEGKFHQVKRMFEKIGTEVTYLKRLSMGSLVLDCNLQPGEYRNLTNSEIDKLKSLKPFMMRRNEENNV